MNKTHVQLKWRRHGKRPPRGDPHYTRKTKDEECQCFNNWGASTGWHLSSILGLELWILGLLMAYSTINNTIMNEMLGMVDFTWQTVNIDDSGCVPAGAHKRIIQDKHECKRGHQGSPYTKTNIDKCTKQIFTLYIKFGLICYIIWYAMEIIQWTIDDWSKKINDTIFTNIH